MIMHIIYLLLVAIFPSLLLHFFHWAFFLRDCACFTHLVFIVTRHFLTVVWQRFFQSLFFFQFIANFFWIYTLMATCFPGIVTFNYRFTVNISVYLSIFVYISLICLSIYLFIYLCLYLSIYLSVDLSICLSIYLSIYLASHLFVLNVVSATFLVAYLVILKDSTCETRKNVFISLQ